MHEVAGIHGGLALQREGGQGFGVVRPANADGSGRRVLVHTTTE